MTPTEREQISTLYHDLIKAWNKRNAGAMAGLFAEEGNLISFDGSQLNGQKEIYAVLDEIFNNFPTAAYVSIIKDIRLLTADTALLLAVVGMVPVGEADITPAVNAIQSITVARVSENWRIALLQNTPAAFHGRPEMAEQLSADLRAVLRTAQ